MKPVSYTHLDVYKRQGDYQIQDDENFNQAEFLKKVAECPKCPKSACPSPERFREAYHTEAEHVYVITLSSHLSGSYNSAVLGMNLYREKYGKKQIHIIDSESASCGETQIVKKLVELEEQGLSFEEIVKQIEEFRSNVHTYFVLDNLDTLRKNGRLTGVKALVASTLSIKPIMAGDKGSIVPVSYTHLDVYKRQEYDRIITGDLGSVGQTVLIDLLREKGIDIADRHMDCGIEIFDAEAQDTHAGGSGCGCSAVTLAAYILPKLESGEWKKVLFLPTGALLSKTSFNEGKSVPGIAHAVVLESPAVK